MKSRKTSLLLLAFALVPITAQAYGGFVQFFEDKDFKGSAVTLDKGKDASDLKDTATDDGKTGFNDKCSSVKYDVPDGWQAVIYDDVNFQKRVYVLKGTGEMNDLSKASDKCSSIRWERR